jgi:hypothetical protein
MLRSWRRWPCRAATVVAAVVVALLAVGCGLGASSPAADTAPPVRTTTPSDAGRLATTPSIPATSPSSQAAKASRANPLAQRSFRVNPEPTTAAQRAAVSALQGYLDGLVTAFATNDLSGSGVRRYAGTNAYAAAQRIVNDQLKAGYVLYGAYRFTVRWTPRAMGANVAVVNVCVDQHATRRHDAKTDRAGPRNDTPFVELDYTLNRRDVGGWVVVSYSGRKVHSCSR